jgi:myo-inositol-1(or 4)-monophosphatase
VDPTELLEVAVEVAGAAAELARTYRADGLRAADLGTKSTVTDIVTAADRAVERLITQRLRERRPYDQILGEEYGADRPEGADPFGAGVRWVVDPIDGTVNYVYGLPQYAVSIAAEVNGVSVAGVVRNAETGEQWTAVRGAGAWRDGVRLTGSTATDLAQSLVATGFGYDADRRAHQARVLASVLPAVRDIRRFGAASIDLCLAAEGRVDAYFERGLNAWDHAAGGLIAEEAGLLVTGLRGAPPSSAMLVAAPPALHAPLHDLLATLNADSGP